MEVKIAYQAWKLTFIVNISRIEQDIKELSKILNNEVETIEIYAHFPKYTNLRIILMILLAPIMGMVFTQLAYGQLSHKLEV